MRRRSCLHRPARSARSAPRFTSRAAFTRTARAVGSTGRLIKSAPRPNGSSSGQRSVTKPDPIATPGDHCLYCDGAVGCVALQQTTATALAIAETTGHRDRTPTEMAQALHFYRNALEIIKAAAKATEVEAEARAKRGERLPGWGITTRYGTSRVSKPPHVIKALTGKDATKTVPMNIGELRAAGLTKAQLAVITEQPTTGFKLEPLDPDTLARQLNRTNGGTP